VQKIRPASHLPVELRRRFGAKPQLEPVRRDAPHRGHYHPGIIDQQVERIMVRRQPVGECRDRGKAGKIQRLVPDLRAANRLRSCGSQRATLRGARRLMR